MKKTASTSAPTISKKKDRRPSLNESDLSISFKNEENNTNEVDFEMINKNGTIIIIIYKKKGC